ncbi:hypothetical protein GGF46_005227 [Coemansia sp. RSA 552]|nr:hypothetical protein GGF46_005227 [Coemansia sp. RSA 552]
MVDKSLLDAYVFDYLKKKGCLQTALVFAEECKDLPLAEITSDDPRVDMAAVRGDSQKDAAASDRASVGSAADTSSPSPAIAPASAPAGTAARAAAAAAASDAVGMGFRRVPSVNVPTSTQSGFLLEWWTIFWDVYAATSERRPNAVVPESIRTYTQHQAQRHTRRMSNAANINGKRSAPM